MDDEMEEFVCLERVAFESQEIDMDYEFDAPTFFDFTRPETDWEASEAEDWFRYAGSYPPSPFVVKLMNWHKGHPTVGPAKPSVEFNEVDCFRSVRIDSSNCMETEISTVEDDSARGLRYSDQMAQGTPNAKTKSTLAKSPSVSRISTLMKPTVSQLAKQTPSRRELREGHSKRLLRRVEKKLGKVAENSQNSPLFDSVATKRQKLEAGYMRKVAQLKHQPVWLHKEREHKISCDAISPRARPKVTIPREPNLQTAQRAQRRRFKHNVNAQEQAKIIKEPPWSLPKKSTPQTKEFQVFHFRTTQKAYPNPSDNVTNTPISSCLSPHETTENKGLNSVYAKSDKCKASSHKKKKLSIKEEIGSFPSMKQESRLPSPRELKFPTDNRFQKDPPTDLFSKLSLAPEAHHNANPEFKTAYAC